MVKINILNRFKVISFYKYLLLWGTFSLMNCSQPANNEFIIIKSYESGLGTEALYTNIIINKNGSCSWSDKGLRGHIDKELLKNVNVWGSENLESSAKVYPDSSRHSNWATELYENIEWNKK